MTEDINVKQCVNKKWHNFPEELTNFDGEERLCANPPKPYRNSNGPVNFKTQSNSALTFSPRNCVNVA